MPHRKPASEITSPALLFDGGFNYLDQSQVKPNQLVAGRNWWRDLDGVVRPRPGNKVWNAISLASDFQGLWEYRRASDQVNRLMAYAGGSLFRGDDATKTFALLLAGLDISELGYGANAQDSFWFCNRKQTPRVWDATDLFRIGIVPPAAAPTVALAGIAGNLPAEDHYYRYTYVREVGGIKVRESNPSAESAKVTNTAGNSQNDVTVAASTDAQVTHIYIYRRSSMTVTEYKFVAKTTNASGTYRDNIAIGDLGAFGFWEPSGGEEDHGYPPDGLFGLLPEPHRDGRLYAWGSKSRLHYTRVNQFHYWPGSGSVGTRNGFQIIVNEDDGDEGQALISEGDDLWVLKRLNVYRLLGDGPSADDGLLGSWKLEKVPTKYGCAAPGSAAMGPGGAFWLSDWGPVRVETRTGMPRLIGLELRPWLETSTDITKARGWCWGWHYLLFIPVAGAKWEGHIYDARNGSWWPFEDMDALAFTTREDGTLVWGGILEVDKPNKGVVYEFNKQVSDNGSVVTAELTTRVIDVRTGWWKLMWKVLLACEGNPGAKFTARVIADQLNAYVERELKLNATSGVRMLKPFVGTKQLQGYAFQLYLKSANLTRRPAIYYWQQEIHTLNRQLLHAVPFQAVFLDPDPTISIVEGDFTGGTPTNTRVVSGTVVLGYSVTWTRVLDVAYSEAWSLTLHNGRVVSRNRAAPNDKVRVWAGSAWAEADIGAEGAAGSFAEWNRIASAGSRFYVAVGAAVNAAVRYSDDLATFVQLVTVPGSIGALVMHGGVLHALGFGLAGGSNKLWRIDGGVVTDLGAMPTNGILAGASAFGRIYAGRQALGPPYPLYQWDGAAWTQVWAGDGTSIHDLYYDATLDLLLIATATGVYKHTSGGVTTLVLSLASYAVKRVANGKIYVIPTAAGGTIQFTDDLATWNAAGVPAPGLIMDDVDQRIISDKVMVLADADGDVYAGTLYVASGTYQSPEYDLAQTMTRAAVAVTLTVPTGTSWSIQLGYSATPGGPYTFTAARSVATFQETINGRYLVFKLTLTSDTNQNQTPVIDQVEIVASP